MHIEHVQCPECRGRFTIAIADDDPFQVVECIFCNVTFDYEMETDSTEWTREIDQLRKMPELANGKDGAE